MALSIGKDLGYGTTLIDGNPEVYVIKIVVKWLITKENWGENYVKHTQDALYKIPADLICEILVSLVN